jgi:hypothetical protein
MSVSNGNSVELALPENTAIALRVGQEAARRETRDPSEVIWNARAAALASLRSEFQVEDCKADLWRSGWMQKVGQEIRADKSLTADERGARMIAAFKARELEAEAEAKEREAAQRSRWQDAVDRWEALEAREREAEGDVGGLEDWQADLGDTLASEVAAIRKVLREIAGHDTLVATTATGTGLRLAEVRDTMRQVHVVLHQMLAAGDWDSLWALWGAWLRGEIEERPDQVRVIRGAARLQELLGRVSLDGHYEDSTGGQLFWRKDPDGYWYEPAWPSDRAFTIAASGQWWDGIPALEEIASGGYLAPTPGQGVSPPGLIALTCTGG